MLVFRNRARLPNDYLIAHRDGVARIMDEILLALLLIFLVLRMLHIARYRHGDGILHGAFYYYALKCLSLLFLHSVGERLP